MALAPFDIKGLPIAGDALAFEAGFDLAIAPSAKFGFSHAGQFASDAQDHGFSGDLTVNF